MHASTCTMGVLLAAAVAAGCGEALDGDADPGISDASGGGGLASQLSGGAGKSDGGVGGMGGSKSSGGSAGGAGMGGSKGSGGSAGTGGSSGTGGSPGTGGQDAGHAPGTCNGLAAKGTWEQITPPDVVPQMPGPGNCRYGTGAFVLDPSTDAVYLGTCNMGIWKTTDCGSTWVHVNTGTNGKTLDTGRQWTFAIDPVDPRVLYTNSGYGATSNGAFKSTDGGVNWEVMWPPKDGSLSGIVDYDFVGQIILDPLDHQHLLITWHAVCKAPYNAVCIGESKDAGTTWKLVNGNAGWAGGEGQSAYFLNDSKTWLWESQSNGVWRTTDGGATWTQLFADQAGHGGGQQYRAKDGTFYLAVNDGVLRSPDGISWSLVKIAGPMGGLTSDGTVMYASRWSQAQAGEGSSYLPFYTSPEADGTHWSQLPSPLISDGGPLAYDTDHHILYSSNVYAGFFRVVTQ